jgi:hypothetical protein
MPNKKLTMKPFCRVCEVNGKDGEDKKEQSNKALDKLNEQMRDSIDKIIFTWQELGKDLKEAIEIAIMYLEATKGPNIKNGN